MKPITFHGTSLQDLRAFPESARRVAGHQLAYVQTGGDPSDWKPMRNVGHGAMEIRVKDDAVQFRVIYVAKFADAVHVLHAFQKKTRRTSQADLDLARKRYREIEGA